MLIFPYCEKFSLPKDLLLRPNVPSKLWFLFSMGLMVISIVLYDVVLFQFEQG